MLTRWPLLGLLPLLLLWTVAAQASVGLGPRTALQQRAGSAANGGRGAAAAAAASGRAPAGFPLSSYECTKEPSKAKVCFLRNVFIYQGHVWFVAGRFLCVAAGAASPARCPACAKTKKSFLMFDCCSQCQHGAAAHASHVLAVQSRAARLSAAACCDAQHLACRGRGRRGNRPVRTQRRGSPLEHTISAELW